MTELQKLLAKTKIDPDETKEVEIGVRVIDDEEIPVVCTIKRITPEKFYELQDKYVTRKGKETKADTYPFFIDIINECCEDPNFRELEFRKQLDATSPKEAIQAVFNLTEISTLANEIIILSGMGNAEFERAREEVKN